MAQERHPLRTIRRLAELSQTTIAERAGMDLNRYFRIEHGRGRKPSPEERAALASALDVPIRKIRFAHDEAEG